MRTPPFSVWRAHTILVRDGINRVLFDEARHLVCEPYSVANLHRVAAACGIKRCWFHRDHYDIPKKRLKFFVNELPGRCFLFQLVTSREVLRVIKEAR